MKNQAKLCLNFHKSDIDFSAWQIFCKIFVHSKKCSSRLFLLPNTRRRFTLRFDFLSSVLFKNFDCLWNFLSLVAFIFLYADIHFWQFSNKNSDAIAKRATAILTKFWKIVKTFGTSDQICSNLSILKRSWTHASFSGNRVSFSGKHISFNGNRVSFSGNRVSFRGTHVSSFDFRNMFARCPIERSVFGTCLLGARKSDQIRAAALRSCWFFLFYWNVPKTKNWF